MPIFRVAWANVVRKLSHSIITLVAMAVAAAVLTSGLSLSEGVAKSAFLNYRTYFEADIVVFTPGFVGAAPIKQPPGTLSHRLLLDSGFNPLLQLYPSFKDEGYYAATWEYRPFGPEDIAEFASMPGVAGVNSFNLMPAGINSEAVGLRATPEGYSSYLSKGREMVAGAPLLEVVASAYGGPKVNIGDLLDLSVPFYGIDTHGIPYVDSTRPSARYRAVVVGLLSWPSRALHFPGDTGIIATEEAYIHASEVYLAPQDWRNIWQQQSEGADYPALSLRLKLNDMSELSAVTRNLKTKYPHLAIFSVPELVERGIRFGLLDRFYFAPAWMWVGESSASQPMAQEDFSTITAALLFINAGMLLASQMLAAVAARRNEIGVLKAIGARKFEVTTMVLIESALLATIGASFGFMLVRAAALHQSLTNGMPMLRLVAETMQEMAIVLGLTVGCALVFGLMPAWSVSRLTVMEVFRRD